MSNSSPFIEKIENTYKRSDLPEFRPGDTIRVHAKISEGGKDRIQVFQGVCIHRKRNGARGAFTVRKISHGVGVERVWAVNSPRVVKIELVQPRPRPQGQALLPAQPQRQRGPYPRPPRRLRQRAAHRRASGSGDSEPTGTTEA
jgi:ribosomal protein L19